MDGFFHDCGDGKNDATVVRFGRSAYHREAQLRPGPIISLNENPSLVALGKLTANEPESLALWGNDVGRTDGQPERENGGTVGWTEGRIRGRADGWGDGRMPKCDPLEAAQSQITYTTNECFPKTILAHQTSKNVFPNYSGGSRCQHATLRGSQIPDYIHGK